MARVLFQCPLCEEEFPVRVNSEHLIQVHEKELFSMVIQVTAERIATQATKDQLTAVGQAVDKAFDDIEARSRAERSKREPVGPEEYAKGRSAVPVPPPVVPSPTETDPPSIPPSTAQTDTAPA